LLGLYSAFVKEVESMQSPRTPALRRIQADIRELEKHPSSRYSARPLDDNMFEWHFTIRGPNGTDFEGGVYHGRILLPSEYPFKPPNIVFMTKNGRFEVGTKICLSISAHHEESWQPAWGIRTMLEAIISFLPSEGSGAIGALDWTKDERVSLAKESHNYECPICGLAIEMLSNTADDEGIDKIDDEIAKQIASLNMKVRTASIDIKDDNNNSKNNSTNSTPAKLSLDSPVSKKCDEDIVDDESKEFCDENLKTPEKVVNTTNDSNIIPETPPSVREVRRRVIGARAAATTTTTINEEVTTETRSTATKADVVDITLIIIQYLIGAIIVYLLIRKVKISIEEL